MLPRLLASTPRHLASSSAVPSLASRRTLATAAGAAGGSRTALYAALGVVGAGGAYYAFSSGVSPKDAKKLEDKAKEKLGLQVPPTLPSTSEKAEAAQQASFALSPKEFRSFKLVKKEDYNHNTAMFTFELPKDLESGLTVASALVTRSPETEGENALLDDKSKPVIRPYTPVSAPDVKGELQLLIKKYPQGNMSRYVHEMKEGDSLAIKGPIPKFPYKANEFETIAMIAGGSGITPHWQIMQNIHSNPDDKTKVILVYSNVTEKDILLRERFEELRKDRPAQFSITHVLDKPEPTWSGPKGYLTAETLKEFLPSPDLGEKVKIFVCGPPGQMQAISGGKKSAQDQGELSGALKQLGYKAEQVYKF